MSFRAGIAGAARDYPEYRVKAAFLYNFSRFVAWPDAAFPGLDAPFALCVIGRNPFDRGSLAAIAGRRAHGRRIVIKNPALNELRDTSCHIAFVPVSQEPALGSILEALHGTHALTVGESPDFSESGGAIELKLVESRVRFEINREAAEREGLTVSSQLLRIADALTTTREGGD